MPQGADKHCSDLEFITVISKRCGFEILLETSAETRVRGVTPHDENF